MLLIPLAAAPSQTLAVTLAAQPVRIALRTLGGSLYFTLRVKDEPIVTTRICRNRQRLLIDAKYREFAGDFAFVDLQGDTDPVFPGLGSRYRLVYLSDDE